MTVGRNRSCPDKMIYATLHGAHIDGTVNLIENTFGTATIDYSHTVDFCLAMFQPAFHCIILWCADLSSLTQILSISQH